MQTNSSGSNTALLINALAMVSVVGVLLWSVANVDSSMDELRIGLVVVLAVVLLIFMLFIVAISFARLNLANPQEAMGLPSGSIRALIALSLVMLFMLISIFLVRTVGQGANSGTLPSVASDRLQQLVAEDRVLQIRPNATNPQLSDVTLRTKVSEDGVRLAQQLMTTVGTLVVAVAGFYFGASSVATARGTAAAPTSLTLTGVRPNQGKRGEKVPIREIAGTGFAEGAQVQLRRAGQPDITANDAEVASATKITCNIDLSTAAVGRWDVVVRNTDAGREEARLIAAFEVFDT